MIQFLLLLSILMLIYYTVRIEGLTNPSNTRSKSVLLLGDSVLKNDTYVDKGYSITDQLRNYVDVNIVAQDGAKILDISRQLQSYQLQPTANKIVISIGGNNILEEIPFYNEEHIDNLFDEYKNTILHIKNVLQIRSSNIILCNIYYPPSYMYRKYDKTITKWNKLLDAFAKQHSFKILNIANIMNEQEDFTHEIEPSRIGGNKIVQALKQVI